MLLETKALTKVFGGLTAVSELDFSIAPGEIVGIIGPNGAGKTTVFNLITGVLRPTAGRVYFDGADITGKKPHVTAKLGIGRTFQIASLFADFTVLENVVAAFHLTPNSGFWESLLNTPGYRRKENGKTEKALEILHLLGLEGIRDERAKNLPHGFQKMLGVARALAVNPRLLLLDEPVAGMTHEEITFALDVFSRLRTDRNMTILLVEHNMEIMELCDHLIVLNFGTKIAECTPEEARCNIDVQQAYFGSDEDA